PLEDKHLCQVDGPMEQADSVTMWLADVANRFRNDEVAIGVADEALVPQLQRQLEQSGVKARWVEGVRLGATAPYRLLAGAVPFATHQRYDDFAALLRHPDLEDWPAPKGMPGASLPAQLDQYYNEHLPSRIRADQISRSRNWPDLPAAVARIEAWLK